MAKKSRELPIQDYYTLLQIEYLNYFCRYKIYKREEDIKKFNDICLKKREKIESISRKNCTPSIFSDEKCKQKYIQKFLNEWGMPNFYYRDEYQEKIKGHWDKVYFFFRGEPVKVNMGESIIEGTVKFLDYKTNIAIIIGEGENGKYQHKSHIDNILRILPDDFFDELL